MNTGNGKIARLPRAVREELNRRLDDGEPADTLLPWLNERPEVQHVLAAQFGGRPVSPQNLSEWRQRGFRIWQRQRTACESAAALAERGQALGKTTRQSLSDHLARVLAAELFQCLEALPEGDANPQARWQQLREIIHEARHLRRGDANARRLQIEAERWTHQREVQQERWNWEQDEHFEAVRKETKERFRREALAPIHAASTRSSLREIFKDHPMADKLVWYYTGVLHDLPPEDWKPPESRTPKNPGESEPIQPDQGK
jgi:hypothetical protein